MKKTAHELTTDAYNAFAQQYEKLWGESFQENKTDYFLLQKFCNNFKKEQKVLEVGCGTGNVLQFLLSQGINAYGIDVSEGMLQEAAKHVPKDRLSVMPATHLAFEDESFDGILSRWVLQHVENFTLAMQEKYRVLKKNGICYLAIHISQDNKTHTCWHALPDKAGRLYFILRSKASIESVFQKVGFTITSCEIQVHADKNDRDVHYFLKK